jgi:parvulin-like peptidyl-prolyl cis-trans isomerase-like protein
VATIGTSRAVDQLDIQRASQSLAADPLRTRNPAQWRRSLLDRCVDRELLAMEGERQGLDRDSVVAKLLANREYSTFHREIYKRVLVPQLTPTQQDLAKAREEGHYRAVDLSVILIRTDLNPNERPLAERIAQAARGGARFDSLAKLYSAHPPTKAKGGHIGWLLTRDVNPAWFADARKASVGDVLGPYRGPFGDEIYKIGAFQELSDDSLSSLIHMDRSFTIASDYEKTLLAKYHFEIDSSQVHPLVFAIASESPDSILQSLGPGGTREKQGVRPAIGILARCDGRVVTFRDVMDAASVDRKQIGGLHLDDAAEVYALCARAVVQDLTSRDARERGIDKDPLVARELRLLGEEVRTFAMVRRHVPNPNDAAVRAYFEAHPKLFLRPRTWRVKVVAFAQPESAAQNYQAWRSSGIPDSTFEATRNDIHELKGAGPWTVSAGHNATARFTTLDLSEGSDDPLTRAVADLGPGAVTPPIALPYGGQVVMQVIAVESARPETYEEARVLAHRLRREEDESRWVDTELTRLRAAVPVRILPGRLEATKLASRSTPTGAGGAVR